MRISWLANQVTAMYVKSNNANINTFFLTQFTALRQVLS